MLDDVLELQLDLLGEHVADAVGVAVGRDRVGAHEALIGIVPEIVARADREVARRKVDAEAAIFGVRGRSGGRRGGGRLGEDRRGSGEQQGGGKREETLLHHICP